MSRARKLIPPLALSALLGAGLFWQLGRDGDAPPRSEVPVPSSAAADAAPEAVVHVPARAEPRAGPARATVAIPHRFRFQGVSSVPRARHYHDLMNAYSPDERAIYDGYIARVFPGAMSFYGEAQLEWLAENGFPMPDDVLVAASMTEEDLHALSNQGSPKASFFYVDRVIARLRAEGKTPWLHKSPDELDEWVALKISLSKHLLASGSPFAGLVYAQSSATNPNPEERDTQIVVGHAWARDRGWTADLDIDPTPVHRAEQNVQPSVAIMHFRLIESQVIQWNPQFRHITVTRMPPTDFALYEEERRRLNEEQLERIRAKYASR